MYCENCGDNLKSTDKFCGECGKGAKNQSSVSPIFSSGKWWHRLVKVFYIILHLLLLFIIPVAWILSYSFGEAVFSTLVTLIVYIIAIRLIKITFIYVVLGGSPEWRKEFKRFY